MSQTRVSTGDEYDQLQQQWRRQSDYQADGDGQYRQMEVRKLLNRKVVALYRFDKSNEDDLAFNEHDVLFVVGLNEGDMNWLRARNETTGDEGYIPTSYVRLMDEKDDISAGVIALEGGRQGLEPLSGRDSQLDARYCLALYDYQPEADTFEADGLPHLALAQGELMIIMDQGADQDDGWWLVEKQDGLGTRGHVPSMLVEEVDELDGEDDKDNEGEEEEEEESVGSFEDNGYERAMPPSIEPPPPPPLTPLEGDTEEQAGRTGLNADKTTDGGEEEESAGDGATPTPDKEGDEENKEVNRSSLVPTSFIIIEPTPEIESRKIEDELERRERDGEHGDDDDVLERTREVAHEDRQIVHTKPSSDTSYSVIKEDFVLERPPRRPNCQQAASDTQATRSTPTIVEEESLADTTGDMQPEASYAIGQPNYEPLSGGDSTDILAPPEVVVEHFGGDNNDDANEDQEGEQGEEADECYRSDSGSDYGERQTHVAKTIKRTGNVDVNPILRHHANEFSRQIIEEAIMLAPGTDIGPSTSSPSPNDDDQMEEDEGENPEEDFGLR